MSRGVVRAAIAIIGVAGLVAGTAIASPKSKDVFVGTWTLNVAKSKFDPGPPFGSGKVTGEAVKGGAKYTVDATMGDGRAVHFSYAGAADGSEMAVTGAPNFDSVSVIRPDKKTLIRTERRGGKIIGNTIATLAADGKSFTAESRGTTPAGQKYHNITVWERTKH
jgi:hypothetical protein